MTTTRRYIRIEPAHERVTPSNIISRLAGLRKLKSGWKVKYHPRKSAPTFEFLALTQGNQTPVRFYLGTTDESLLSTIHSELTTAYPASYNLSEEELTLPEQSAKNTDTDNDEDTVESQSIDDARSELLNRTPIAARWRGIGTRSDDWMTPLTQYSQLHAIDQRTDSASVKAPLATAVERLSKASDPTVLQVLFTRYADWEKAANTRKENIQTKHDGFVQSAKTSFNDMLRGYDEEHIRDRRRGRDAPQIGENIRQSPNATSGGAASRQALIDQKNPSQTFLVNMRAAGVPPADATETTIGTVQSDVDALANAFNYLEGAYYELDGKRLTKGLTNIRDPAKKELKRLLDRSLKISRQGRKRPQLILNADELANFVAVPSAHTLTTEGARGTRGKERLQEKKPVRKDLFNLVRMAWWLPQYQDTSTAEFISDVKDLFSRWSWYDEETTEYQIRYELENEIDGEIPLPMNCSNDDMKRYCIGRDQCPYPIYGSLLFPDELYEQLDSHSKSRPN